jgi:hypothetical protein
MTNLLLHSIVATIIILKQTVAGLPEPRCYHTEDYEKVTS